MIVFYGFQFFMVSFILAACVQAVAGGVYTWRALTHPARHRRRLARALATASRDLGHDGLWTIDWQDYRFLLLDDLCRRAAEHGWQFDAQSVYEDRWELRFRRVGTSAAAVHRAPAAVHDHPVAERCTCAGTDFRDLPGDDGRRVGRRPGSGRGARTGRPLWGVEVAGLTVLVWVLAGLVHLAGRSVIGDLSTAPVVAAVVLLVSGLPMVTVTALVRGTDRYVTAATVGLASAGVAGVFLATATGRPPLVQVLGTAAVVLVVVAAAAVALARYLAWVGLVRGPGTPTTGAVPAKPPPADREPGRLGRPVLVGAVTALLWFGTLLVGQVLAPGDPGPASLPGVAVLAIGTSVTTIGALRRGARRLVVVAAVALGVAVGSVATMMVSALSGAVPASAAEAPGVAAAAFALGAVGAAILVGVWSCLPHGPLRPGPTAG